MNQRADEEEDERNDLDQSESTNDDSPSVLVVNTSRLPTMVLPQILEEVAAI